MPIISEMNKKIISLAKKEAHNNHSPKNSIYN